MIRLLLLAFGCCITLAIMSVTSRDVFAVGPQSQPVLRSGSLSDRSAAIDRYCVTCHNQKVKAGGLALDAMDPARVADDAEGWEKVVTKLRSGVMPPAGRPRPDRADYDGLRRGLEAELDRAAAANPNPGRKAMFHRLNRVEYRNAIRDLLALDVDVDAWLPADPSSYGFDNIGDVLGISPLRLERYLSVAQRVSRLAIGDPEITPTVVAYVIPSDLTQRDRLDGLPFGTRGGAVVHHYFPVDGEYAIQVRLGRNFNNIPVNLREPHEIEVTVDGERVALLTIGGQRREAGAYRGGSAQNADDELRLRLPVKAGPRVVGVAFLKRPSRQFEDVRKPILRDEVEYSETLGMPVLGKVEIDGPYGATGAGETPARRRIFVCRPTGVSMVDADCARTILSTLARRAYRRPVTEADLDVLLRFYDEGRMAGGFERGVEAALVRILASPWFLLRIEREPADIAPRAVYRISDLEFASRLSFFLWSSIPDDELLDLAERGRLSDPAVRDGQVRRMLADPRSEALVRNFTGQWLHLRNVPDVKPDRWAFPEFDENLRRAFQRETELFIDSILRDDRSVLDLLAADYTFVNERLARHYGISHVYGDHFRRVQLSDEARGGLLGHGSILTVRSYANRTSPVQRGVWILENILGTKPPDPPPNVPELEETRADGKILSMRERMVQHRANPVCASCHAVMDPLGLALENFDAVGGWRSLSEAGTPIDVSAALPDGTTFDGPVGLKKALLGYSDAFVTTMAEKLLTYALGRGLEFSDAPTVRRIARQAAESDYRFSALVLGIVGSEPFQMRRSPDAVDTAAGAGR